MTGGSLIAVLTMVIARADAVTVGGLESKEEAMLQDTTRGPVEKVMQLLQDMSKQMKKDAEDDADVNEAMGCWCKTNIAGKTKAIEDNTDLKGQLETEIEGLRAKSQELNTQIANLDTEVKDNQKALDTAIEVRKKDVAEFNDAEKSAMTTIGQLDGAEGALRSKTPSAMMQNEIVLEAGSPVGMALTRGLHERPDLLWDRHSREERRIMKDLLAKSRDLNLIQGGSQQSVTAPSDIIYGVISQMKETFQSDLSKLQQNELDDSAHHEEVKEKKTNEIQAGIDMIDLKTGELADTDERAAAARVELDDTETALANDQEFLGKVQEQCAFHDKEYSRRLQVRQTEMMAVAKAMAILSDDNTRNLFTKTFGHSKRAEKLGSRGLKEFKEERETQSLRSQTNKARKAQWGTSQRYLLNQEKQEASSFIQVSSEHIKETTPAKEKLSTMAKRTQAYWKAKYYMEAQEQNRTAAQKKEDLKKKEEHPKAAKPEPEKRNKLGLTASEMAIRKGGMSGAAGGVTRMRHALEFQQGEEKARKTWCVDEIHTVEKDIDNANRKKADIEEKIELMAQRMARLREEVKQMKYDQEDADIELAKASIDRRKANTNFQKTVVNHLETKRTLGTAMAVLEEVWGKLHKKASLLRESTKASKRLQNVMGTFKRVAEIAAGEDKSLSFQDAQAQEMQAARPSTALIQDKKRTPNGKVAEILNAAKQENSDAEALIKAGQAMAQPPKAVPAKAMIQQEPAGPPPPPGLKKYGNSAAGGGLLTMLENLQEDSQAMVDEQVKDETEAMKAYEVVVAEANKATEIRQTGITNRRLEIGKLEEFTQESKIALSEVNHLRATLRQHDIDLYGVEGCSYLIKNYETRYFEREEEINSLKEAEAVLGVSGGDPKMAAAAHTEEMPKTDLGAGEEEEEPEEEEKPAGSSAKVVPEGVKIEGPNGETAISKMIGAK